MKQRLKFLLQAEKLVYQPLRPGPFAAVSKSFYGTSRVLESMPSFELQDVSFSLSGRHAV